MAIKIMFVGLIIFLAHFLSALFDKKKIPDVLSLVLLGLVLGPILGLVTPEFFGQVGYLFTIVTLVIILFQGGLDLNLVSLRESLTSGLRLTLINFVATIAVVTLGSIFVFNLPILEGLILGTILGGTSSAIVVPLIKKLRLKQQSRTALFLESTFSDVLCIVITLGLIQAVRYRTLNLGLMCGQIIASFSLAAVIGMVAAFFWSNVFYKIRHLENGIFLTPAFVFILYGVVEFFGYSGAISALAFGITIGNAYNFNRSILKNFVSFKPIEFNHTENAFFAEIVFLLKTFFFIFIGLSIKLGNANIIFGGLAITMAIFFIRIPVVRLAMKRTATRFDISIISAMVPKGLAAAVLASLPLQMGIENGATIQNIIYSVILFSIIFTVLLIFLIERNVLQQFYAIVFSRYANEGVPTVITGAGKEDLK